MRKKGFKQRRKINALRKARASAWLLDYATFSDSMQRLAVAATASSTVLQELANVGGVDTWAVVRWCGVDLAAPDK